MISSKGDPFLSNTFVMATVEENEKQPGVIGFYIYAIIMALFGACLGFAYLATFPAQAFASQAEYEASVAKSEEGEEPVFIKPGDAYYIEGPILRSRSWEPKRTQLAAPGPQTVRFSAGEINGWMTAKFRPAAAPTGEDASGLLIVPGVPNVGLVDGGMYLNLPVNVTAYGASGDYTVSVFGPVDRSGLKVQSIGISSAKVPLPGIIGGQIIDTLSKGYQTTDEYKIIAEAFARADSIAVEVNELVFVLR